MPNLILIAKDVRKFFNPMLAFVEEGILAGEGVLVHCFAGAHRARTARIAWVMHLAKYDAETATKECQKIRGVIDPDYGDGGLAHVLELLGETSS